MGEKEGACHTQGGKVSDRGEVLQSAACAVLGFTLSGRWTSQLHRECRDRRNGSQLGFRLFFTTLRRPQRAGHSIRFPHSALPLALSMSPGTNLSPPDQLVTLVPVGLIDLHERVRLAEQILGHRRKSPRAW